MDPALPTCAVCSQFPSVSCVSEEHSAPLFPSLHSSPLNPRRKPTHTRSHTQSEAETTASSESGYADTRRSTVLAVKAMLQRLQKVEDKISQVISHLFLFCFFSYILWHLYGILSANISSGTVFILFLFFPAVVFPHVCAQRKAQTENAREFHMKNIKEKAVHLSALFSGEAASQHQVTTAVLLALWLTISCTCSLCRYHHIYWVINPPQHSSIIASHSL